MAYGLEWQFDPATDAAVRRVWDALEAAGIATPRREAGRPHLSLVRCDVAGAAALAAAVARFAQDVLPLDVEFGAVGVFAPEGWVYLAPVPSAQLLDTHARVHEWLAGLVGTSAGVTAVRGDAYVPGRWVPHCTLTARLEPALAAQAVQLCLRTDLPRMARIERIGLTHYPPVAELYSFALGGEASV